MKTLLFLTTSNLTTNPRLSKEVSVLRGRYNIIVVLFRLGNWSDEFENNDKSSLAINDFHYLNATKTISWALSSFVQRISSFLTHFNLRFLNAFYVDKRSLQILWYLKRKKLHADFILSHNLGALYPAYMYSKIRKIPFSFDVEDYHPGEGVTEIESTVLTQARKRLMQRILPEARFVTFASPLIMEKVLEWCPGIKKPTLINNSFFSKEFHPPAQLANVPCKQPIKLVWFSQNIAAGRGLELMIHALNSFGDDFFELHLIGNLNEEFGNEWIIQNKTFIRIHEPLGQHALHRKLSEFDIGLATELNEADYNRQICLTNKIFAYAQTGLFILATDTPSQKRFLDDNPWAGILADQSSSGIIKALKLLIQNREDIAKKMKDRFQLASSLSYESEAIELNELIQKSLVHA